MIFDLSMFDKYPITMDSVIFRGFQFSRMEENIAFSWMINLVVLAKSEYFPSEDL